MDPTPKTEREIMMQAVSAELAHAHNVMTARAADLRGELAIAQARLATANKVIEELRAEVVQAYATLEAAKAPAGES